jgi:pimeloyl-ACP methyl ester carboxylesterase
VYGTEHGFAVVASNNGHNGTSGKAFYQNPQVLHDFADRAMHSSVTVGKEIIKQFYRKEQHHSYFLGCSQGGRQGIASAVKHPQDFDGIIAGAPALDFNSLASWRASFYPLTGPSTSADFIQPELWSSLIHIEALRQCDHLDGVTDGVIEYPDLCDFRPETLLCHPGETAGSTCLSQVQVNIVQRIFRPFKHPDGTLIYPGMQIGSEKRAIDRLYAGKPFTDSQDWFRYVVHSDQTWDPASFTADDARQAQALNPFNIQTFPTAQDLQPFHRRGGRILTYHGMQDQQITGHNTGRWMDYLRRHSSDQELDRWIRYFRISGLLHCSGGSGAWMIGQTGGSASFDREKNVLAVIVEWTENNNPPETLEGSSATSAYTRRHCR